MSLTGISRLVGQEIQDIIEAAKVGCSKTEPDEHFDRVDSSSGRNDFIVIE
jgi:hypothetical protein